jgi:group I intron endonuclease
MIEPVIYKIVNAINNKIYVGSTIYKTKRWRAHKSLLKNGYHHSPHLQRAWNKYGSENFVFEVLETVTITNIHDREQFYLDTLNPEYNVCKDAGPRGSRLGIKHTEESKEKNRQAQLGKKLSDETKRKISKSNTGKHTNKGRVLTNEHKNKLVKKDFFLQFDLDGKLLNKLDRIQIREIFEITHLANIVSCCTGRVKSAYGFTWKFYQENQHIN